MSSRSRLHHVLLIAVFASLLLTPGVAAADARFSPMACTSYDDDVYTFSRYGGRLASSGSGNQYFFCPVTLVDAVPGDITNSLAVVEDISSTYQVCMAACESEILGEPGGCGAYDCSGTTFTGDTSLDPELDYWEDTGTYTGSIHMYGYFNSGGYLAYYGITY